MLRYIKIFLLPLLLIIGIFIFYKSEPEDLFCEDLYNEIIVIKEEFNFCDVSSDCETILLNNWQIDCYGLFNKEVDKSPLYKKMNKWKEECWGLFPVHLECDLPPEEKVCVLGKCVYAQNDESNF